VDVAGEARRAWVVFSLTLRYLLMTRRGFGVAALGAVPLILTGALAAARVATFDILLFQVLMVPLFLQVVLIFVTLVQATALVREEIEDNTLVYLLTRPVSKPALALYKYLGYYVAVLVLVVPSLVLSYVVTQAYSGDGLGADLDVLGAFLATTALGGAAYGAFFLFLSVVIRKPLAVGLLFGFVWESIVGSIPGDVPKLSIIHYLRSILKDMIAVGPLRTYPTDVSAPLAAVVLVAFTAVLLGVAMFAFQKSEFKQKA
jgi:ABC-2 type transport system permease protein